MKKIIRLRAESEIPEGARYLHSAQEIDKDRRYHFWRPSKSWFQIPILFEKEDLIRVTPVSTFHYYEVQEEGEPE